MVMTIARGIIAGLIVISVTEVSRRSPRLGALLLTLPLVSILAFIAAWSKDGDLAALSALARDTLILVPLGLPFFVPLAFASRLGLGFWSALVAGLVLTTLTIGLWMTLSNDNSLR